MITNTTNKVIYTGDGTTIEFLVTFPFSNTSELKLYLHSISEGTNTEITSNWSYSSVTGKITYPTVEAPMGTPLSSDEQLIIIRQTPLTQEKDHDVRLFTSKDVEDMADKLTREVQDIKEQVDRSVKYPVSYSGEPVEEDEFIEIIEQYADDAIAAHNASNTSHTDIRTLANNAMPKSGGTFTGNVSMSNGTSINFPHYKIGENGSGNAIIGDNNGNGLVVLPNGEGAALFTNGGSEYSELVRFKDVKSTYNSSSTYPMDGVAVAQAVAGEAEARQLADAGLQGQITTLGTNKQDKLTDSQLLAVNSGIDSTKVSQIATNTSAISNETINRQNEDIALQGQIDALKAASDVVDVVNTYSELQSYDTSKLTDKDLVKVLSDERHNDAETYYRWSTSTSSFSYVGSAGASYTKAESDAKFLSQTSAASTYETIANVATGLAGKASNADNASIVDNGTTITTVGIKEQNASAIIKKWYGTKAQLDAISTKDSNTEYTTTDENDGQLIVIDNALSSSSENPVQNKVIKTALDAKQATITGGASTIASSNLTASRALVSNSSGKVAVSSVTSTELGYISGVTSAIQTQLNAKQTTANLVTSVSSSSTDSQYPSAKLFYDTCGDIETLINAL